MNKTDSEIQNKKVICEALSLPKSIISGLEGCSKSLGTIAELLKTTYWSNPVIVGFKTYELMAEQRKNWQKYFSLSSEEIVIAGITKTTEGMKYYTNKEYPGLIPPRCRIIMMTQKAIQLQHNQHFIGMKNRDISRIVIDEFDFSLSVMPSMDFILSQMKDNNVRVKNGNMTAAIHQFMSENYLPEDRQKAALGGENQHFVGHWIDESKYPITFLTSERLACEVLKAIGFIDCELVSPVFDNSIIHINPVPYLNRKFYEIAKNRQIWKFIVDGFDVVVSDKTETFSDTGIAVINHTRVRGTNNLKYNPNTDKTKKILTIITHIPKYVIELYHSAINQFSNTQWKIEDIKELFYRDRLHQSIGRNLGFRSNPDIETNHYVLMNELIWNALDSWLSKLSPAQLDAYPYRYMFNWEANIPNKEELLNELKDYNSDSFSLRMANVSKTLEPIDTYFDLELDKTKTLSYKDIEDYIAEQKIYAPNMSYVNAGVVIKYFGDKVIKNVISKRIDGKPRKIITYSGLKLKLKKENTNE